MSKALRIRALFGCDSNQRRSFRDLRVFPHPIGKFRYTKRIIAMRPESLEIGQLLVTNNQKLDTYLVCYGIDANG